MSSARAAFSRKREPKSAVSPTSRTTRSSISSGSSRRSSAGGGASLSGRWSAIPSSDQSDCASRPSESRRRAASAIAHGAWTRAPNGVSTQTRQSPISSRNRSTTTVRSEGTAPVAASCSRRKVRRFPRRALVEVVFARAAARRAASSVRATSDARRAPDPLAELVRPADTLALSRTAPRPERRGPARRARGRA